MKRWLITGLLALLLLAALFVVQCQLSHMKADMLAELAAAILRADDPIPPPRNRYRTKLHPKGYWFDRDYIAPDPGVPQDRASDYFPRANEKD